MNGDAPASPAEKTKRVVAWRVWAPSAAGLLAIGWLVNASPSFKYCIHTQKNDPSYHALRENPSVVRGTAIRVELHAVCVEGWTEKYEGAIGAIATVFIAIFTLTLWDATKRLWQSADKELAEFQRSLIQARKIANEQITKMDSHIEEAASAATAMKDLVRTTRETAASQLRAYVSIKSAGFQAEHGVITGYIGIKIKNYGLTPASDVRIRVEYSSGPRRDESAAFPLSDKAVLYPKVHIPPGQTITIHAPTAESQTDSREWFRRNQAEEVAYLWGRINYKDAFGEERFTTWQMLNHFTSMTAFGWCEEGNDAS
jgi:hypothetical protein